VGPRQAGAAPRRSRVPTIAFDAPALPLDDAATRLVADRVLRAHLAGVLGRAPVLAHHLPAALVTTALGLPTLVALHSLWPCVRAARTGEPEGPRGPACAALLARAAAVLLATDAERAALLRTAPPAALDAGLASRIAVVPQGPSPFAVRLARRDGLERRRRAWRRRLLPEASDADVVLYVVSRLVPYKRPLEVIASFVRVADAVPRARLLVAGPPTDAANAARCVEAVRAAPPSVARRIAFVGPQPLEAAPLAGDVVVHASRYETWGRAVDEAMVFGRPAVLATSPFVADRLGLRGPGGPDDGAAAIGVEPDDGDALDAALVRAATDATWRSRCGEALRRRAAALDPEAPVVALLTAWNAVERAHDGSVPFSLPPCRGATEPSR
jgi:glycosyltransferase involved in cell wall biosynthesis